MGRLVEGSVNRLAFDYGVEFVVDGAMIRIEGIGTIEDADGRLSFDAEQSTSYGKKVLGLLGKSVEVDVRGSVLVIRAVGGSERIEVPSSDEYEAWSLVKLDGSRIVCTVGGQLASWPASS